MFFMLYWERPEERDRAAEDQAYTDKMHQTHGVFTFNTLLVPFLVLFCIVSVLLHLRLLLFSRFSSIQHARRVRFFHMSNETSRTSDAWRPRKMLKHRMLAEPVVLHVSCSAYLN